MAADAAVSAGVRPGVGTVTHPTLSRQPGPVAKVLTRFPYFYIYTTMKIAPPPVDVARLAGMMAAMGTEPRLRIMRLLLFAHPDGLVVGEIQDALGISGPTLSHHLEKLRHQDLVYTRREGTFLRYLVNTETLQILLGFLLAECCGRNKAVAPGAVLKRCSC